MSGFMESKYSLILAILLVMAFLGHRFIMGANAPVISGGETIVPPLVLQEGSYAEFLHYHTLTPSGTERISVDIFNPSSGENFEILTNFEGEERALRTEEESYVEFTVNIPQAGLYNLHIEYFPVAARGINIGREIRINGEVPFGGAELINLRRVWGSANEPQMDNQGNMIRPTQVELPRWEAAYLRNRLGFFVEPYRFYFHEGVNTITLVGDAEPLVMRALTVTPIHTPPTFQEFMAATDLTPAPASFAPLRLQGESSTVRSSPSLFPLFDSSSGATDPPSVAIITLNMIGGHPWRIPGQWIEWEVEVPADGLYRLSVSARQNYNRGFVSHRSLYINGEIPFQEVAVIPFHFNNGWELITFQDDNGTDLLFPLKAGVNTIRMEVTLGELGEIIENIMASVERLNSTYREILVLTGSRPDPLRDYRIDQFLPHVMEMIYLERGVLYGVLNDLIEFIGGENQHTGTIATMVRQLDTFYRRPYQIPIRLVNWRQNISSMGETARVLMEGQLDIDFFYISAPGASLPPIRENFVTRTTHEVRSFVASFTHDFDALGNVHEGDRVIDVWIPTGRDQATVMKSMIDDSFVPEFGIGVNLRLVAPPAVLPAVVAGIGPDVLVSMPNSDPINYALRNAVVDLSQFATFPEVVSRFHESAMVPFEFQGRYYALPETQQFSVMFYRTDIFDNLELTPPTTWQEVLGIMPLLQRNNMEVGIPPIGDPMNPDLGGFLTQLYQRDGFLYNDDNSRAILDSEEAVEAFEAFTRFFTHFGSPQFYDFPNRFRSGEMPIAFADFSFFNLFSVFAPEISGLWNFGLMPGHVWADGTVDHTVPAWGVSTMILEQSEMQYEAWQFLDWWTSTETQLRFGRELESVMGEAARFPTANVEAFNSLPWSTAELTVLNEQRDWILGTPEVPGGYYVTRHLVNAIRRVINENVDTRETLLDFNIVINRELINKRREFGLE